MIVARNMRKPLITIRPHDTLAHAQSLMQTHRIRHLPVVEGGRLIGILSSHDVREAVPLPAAPEAARAYAERLGSLPAAAAMTQEVVSGAPSPRWSTAHG